MSEIEEVAKTTGKAIDAAREAGGFLARFAQKPLEQVAGIVWDHYTYIRWERRVRLMARADQFLKDQGLTGPTRAVPLKFAHPIMLEGSLEESDELQDRWAQLLVNAADKDSGISVEPMYISILKDLSPQDARVLDAIDAIVTPSEWSFKVEGSPEGFVVRIPHQSEVTPTENESAVSPDLQLVLGNLGRLGLISIDRVWSGVTLYGGLTKTLLGQEFVKACSVRPAASN